MAISAPSSASGSRRSAAARCATPTTWAPRASSPTSSASPPGTVSGSPRVRSCRSKPAATPSSIPDVDSRYLMFRAGLLWLSEQPQVFRFVRRNGLARKFASRFVAGETVERAVAALADLNAARISASLDLLGESVTSPAEARAARDVYLHTLDLIH